eukprot:8347507-Pyramimonas_sp.AAC.1
MTRAEKNRRLHRASSGTARRIPKIEGEFPSRASVTQGALPKWAARVRDLVLRLTQGTAEL